jgi:hypothetical protein
VTLKQKKIALGMAASWERRWQRAETLASVILGVNKRLPPCGVLPAKEQRDLVRWCARVLGPRIRVVAGQCWRVWLVDGEQIHASLDPQNITLAVVRAAWERRGRRRA